MHVYIRRDMNPPKKDSPFDSNVGIFMLAYNNQDESSPNMQK
jgi:hypothetical protein